MRVIAGSAGSLRLVTPKGVRLRPTSDAMREALFSSLADLVPGCRFLDVYAGTGSVGIEALSRGAEHCTFIERDRRCVQAIRRNLENTQLTAAANVIQLDAQRAAQRLSGTQVYDIAFVDPPYDDAGALSLFAQLIRSEIVAADGLLILQHSRRADIQPLPEPYRAKRFGDTLLSFFAPEPEEP